MASESTRNRRRVGIAALMAGLLSGNHTRAQEQLRAGLAGDPSTARATLAALPATPSPDVVLAVVELLQRPNADLRNEAMVWLMAHGDAAATAAAALQALRDRDQPDAARAAATVLANLRQARPVDPTDLRAELARADLRPAALRKLVSAPELGWPVLPELLASKPLSNVQPVLEALRQLDTDRLRGALQAALPGPGDGRGIVEQLGALGLDPASIEALDRALEHPDASTREPAALLLARWVRGGIAPPPRWLALLRSAGQPPARMRLLNELAGQPLPPSLRGELDGLLAEPGLWAASSMLVDLGADAAAFAPALRRSLGNLTVARRAGLAPCVGELAPATRDCAELLLPCLAEADRTTVLPVLIALVELDDIGPAGIDAIADCLRHVLPEVRLDAVAALGALRASGAVDRIRAATVGAAAGFAELAALVTATLVPDTLSVDDLLLELAGTDPHRRLVAAAALRDRAVPAVRLVGHLPQHHHTAPWATHVIQRCVGSMLVRRITADPLADDALAGLTAWPNATAQDRVRIHRRAAAGAAGITSLRHRLLGNPVEQRIVLQALTQPGADAQRIVPLAAPFVHHPDAALREAAVACLRAVGGDDAVAAARASADPWARWSSIVAGATGNAILMARDPAMPTWMRTDALRRIRPGVAAGHPELFALVADPDDELAEAALRLCLFRNPHDLDANVLPAFAGGSPAVRAGLGAALRSHLELPWPGSTLVQLLSLRNPPIASAGQLLDHQSIERRAVDQLRRQQLRPPVAWSLRQLEGRPQLGLWLLHELPAAPEPELLPALTALATTPRFAPLAEALLVRAGAPLPPLRPHSPTVTTAPDEPPRTSQDWHRQLLQLQQLPWRRRPSELDPQRETARALWQQLSVDERSSLHPLLRAMGPLAAFAVDDLAAQLGAEPTAGACSCATTLVELGRIDLVRSWLQGLPLDPIPRIEDRVGAELVEQVWAQRLAAQFVESADLDVMPRAEALVRYRHALSAADLDAVSIRLLSHAEAHPHASSLWLLRSLPPIGDRARAQFAASYQRRRAQPIRPDPFAEALAILTMAAFPDLAAAAMRDGLVRCEAALQTDAIAGPNVAIREHAATLTAVVAASRERCITHIHRQVRDGEVDPHLGALLGFMLHRAGAAPIAALQERLHNADTREFALAALTGLGSAAEPASAVVAAWLGTAPPEDRLRIAHALVRLGPGGVQQLGAFIERDSGLLPAMLYAFTAGDEPVQTAAAQWLGSGRVPPAPAVRESLTAALQTSHLPDARAAMLLALLHHGHTPTQRDWLELANWRSAAMRARLVAAYAPYADGPIPWGVLAERLDDEAVSVRTAAATALLADPDGLAACRRALAEFAASAPPELAARIAAALAR